MKKILFICLVGLLQFGCSKNEDALIPTNQNVSVNLLKIKNVSEMKEQETKKVAYLLLNDEEKFIFWSDHLSEASNDEELSDDQQHLFSVLIKNLKTEVFSERDNDYKSYFKDIFVKNYLVELQKKFTRSEIEDIFYNAGNLIAPRNNCNCNRGSMFGCGTSGNCYGACNTNTITNSGCGFLWAWECNAKCKLF
jgi:hypothetical protein